jgi:AcrR family transcriptional regulator
LSNAQRSGAGTKSNRRVQAGRRKEIIDAAAAIFQEKGYAATSIQDVADAVNILKGSLYYYIKSKDDLLFEVIQEVHEGGLENLEEGKRVGGSALERIRDFVTRHMTYNARNLTKMTVFFHDFRSLSAERRALIVEERDLYDLHLRSLILSGQAEGSVRAEVDPKMAAFSILGSMNWMYQWYRSSGSRPLEEIADEFAEFAVDSVRNPSWDGPA